jgi:hypothetical protein
VEHHLDHRDRVPCRHRRANVVAGCQRSEGFHRDEPAREIGGAFVATFLGQAVGWYRLDQGAGFIGAIVGAIIVLFVYGVVAGRQRRAI